MHLSSLPGKSGYDAGPALEPVNRTMPAVIYGLVTAMIWLAILSVVWPLALS